MGVRNRIEVFGDVDIHHPVEPLGR
jgi:hypothetical protein